MKDIWLRYTGNLLERIGGPLTLRFVFQSLVVRFFGIRSGLRDVREGKPPYVWSLFSSSGKRLTHLRKGWREIARAFAMILVIDLVYQVIFLRWLYPFEALTVAALVAVAPYVVIRSLTNRLVRWKAAGR